MINRSTVATGMFLFVVGASFFMQRSTNDALARCESQPGATIAECRLVVLGR